MNKTTIFILLGVAAAGAAAWYFINKNKTEQVDALTALRQAAQTTQPNSVPLATVNKLPARVGAPITLKGIELFV